MSMQRGRSTMTSSFVLQRLTTTMMTAWVDGAFTDCEGSDRKSHGNTIAVLVWNCFSGLLLAPGGYPVARARSHLQWRSMVYALED